jgi:hypothetical protein
MKNTVTVLSQGCEDESRAYPVGYAGLHDGGRLQKPAYQIAAASQDGIGGPLRTARILVVDAAQYPARLLFYLAQRRFFQDLRRRSRTRLKVP